MHVSGLMEANVSQKGNPRVLNNDFLLHWHFCCIERQSIRPHFQKVLFCSTFDPSLSSCRQSVQCRLLCGADFSRHTMFSGPSPGKGQIDVHFDKVVSFCGLHFTLNAACTPFDITRNLILLRKRELVSWPSMILYEENDSETERETHADREKEQMRGLNGGEGVAVAVRSIRQSQINLCC